MTHTDNGACRWHIFRAPPAAVAVVVRGFFVQDFCLSYTPPAAVLDRNANQANFCFETPLLQNFAARLVSCCVCSECEDSAFDSSSPPLSSSFYCHGRYFNPSVLVLKPMSTKPKNNDTRPIRSRKRMNQKQICWNGDTRNWYKMRNRSPMSTRCDEREGAREEARETRNATLSETKDETKNGGRETTKR